MVLDVADRHPAGVEADDHLIEPTESPGALRDQPWDERPTPVAGHVQVDVADLGGQCLRRGSVARVREQRRLRRALLIAQVVGQLGLQTAFERGLDQPGDEATIPGQLQLAGVDPGENRVQRTRRGELRSNVRTTRRLVGNSFIFGHEIHLVPFQMDRSLTQKI